MKLQNNSKRGSEGRALVPRVPDGTQNESKTVIFLLKYSYFFMCEHMLAPVGRQCRRHEGPSGTLPRAAGPLMFIKMSIFLSFWSYFGPLLEVLLGLCSTVPTLVLCFGHSFSIIFHKIAHFYSFFLLFLMFLVVSSLSNAHSPMLALCFGCSFSCSCSKMSIFLSNFMIFRPKCPIFSPKSGSRTSKSPNLVQNLKK